MAMGNGNGNGDRVGDDDGDGYGDRNVDGHSEGDDDKGRVASLCAGDVQRYGRGDTLPPPPWTQKKVHSPALCHGGDTAKSVSFLSRGGFLTAHHGLFFCLFFTTTVQFTEQPSVRPPLPTLFRCSRTLSAH